MQENKEENKLKMREELLKKQSDSDAQPAENNTAEREIETVASAEKPNYKFAWLITLAVLALVGVIGIVWINSKRNATAVSVEKEETKETAEAKNESGREVKLTESLLNSAGIVTEGVTQRPAIAKLTTTGTVEMNPEKTEMATPLVGGRIENVYFGVGDFVQQGALMATISSPQIAQLHGKMHEARTRYELAQRNLARVQKSENRVSVLQAKAKLDEAQATLTRTKRLIELGAGAGKDLISAETNYKTAKADYDFQSNIALNKELQEARAEVETSHVDLIHIEDEMRSLGVPYNINQPDDHSKDTSLVAVRAPLSGQVTERKFNAGAGIEAAQPIYAISNLSTVYVVANVPEASISRLSVGSIAEITSPVVGTINGRVAYIEPKLDESTRTARVRLEVPNGSGRLRAGMFTEIGFQAGTGAGGEELVVNSAAVQRTSDKTVVFVPRGNEPGAFEVREVETAGDVDGFTRITSGLKLGEIVVTKGSFVLKTQLEKASMEEE